MDVVISQINALVASLSSTFGQLLLPAAYLVLYRYLMLWYKGTTSACASLLRCPRSKIQYSRGPESPFLWLFAMRRGNRAFLFRYRDCLSCPPSLTYNLLGVHSTEKCFLPAFFRTVGRPLFPDIITDSLAIFPNESLLLFLSSAFSTSSNRKSFDLKDPFAPQDNLPSNC
jgi:hypothetical protein